MKQINTRQSNFELLRIVCILGIILHHLIIKGASTCGYVTPYNFNKDGIFGVILNSFIVGGVNCFVLITGWFGVSNPFKGFLKILCETVVFGCISYGVVVMCTHEFSVRYLIDSIDFRKNWFVNSYFMLLLFAPIIEKSLANILYDDLKRWIIQLSIFNIVFVFLFHNFDNNGYNVIQFIYLYYIARFLKVSYNKNWCSILRKYSAPLYFMTAIFLTLGFLYCQSMGIPVRSIAWFGYNQPLVLLLSIAFFMIFAKLNIKSCFINNISKGVFGVYILHTTTHIIPLRNEFAHNIYTEYGYCGIVSLSLLIFIVCIGCAIPCSRLINRYLTRIYTNK